MGQGKFLQRGEQILVYCRLKNKWKERKVQMLTVEGSKRLAIDERPEMWQRWGEEYCSVSFLLVRVCIAWTREHHGMCISWHRREGQRAALDVSSHGLPSLRQVFTACCCKHWASWPTASRDSSFYTLPPSLCRMQWLQMHNSTSGFTWVFSIHTPVLLVAWHMVYLQKHFPRQERNTCFNEDSQHVKKKNH